MHCWCSLVYTMMTMAIPLSTVSTTLDVSCLSCVKALHSSIVRLGFVWVHWFFSSQLVSDLNSSASLVGSWEQVSSIAVM